MGPHSGEMLWHAQRGIADAGFDLSTGDLDWLPFIVIALHVHNLALLTYIWGYWTIYLILDLYLRYWTYIVGIGLIFWVLDLSRGYWINI